MVYCVVVIAAPKAFSLYKERIPMDYLDNIDQGNKAWEDAIKKYKILKVTPRRYRWSCRRSSQTKALVHHIKYD